MTKSPRNDGWHYEMPKMTLEEYRECQINLTSMSESARKSAEAFDKQILEALLNERR